MEGNLPFAKLMVCTEAASLAHIDLFGRKLKVGSVVDTANNVIVPRGIYTLADATANGWAWFEDSVGGGKLVVGAIGGFVVVR